MRKITTFFWFNDQAEEAANFYTSLFDDSRVLDVQRSGPAGPGEEGSVLLVRFELAGQEFLALNGGPEFRFTEAVSLYVDCETQDEVDRLWTALTDGGAESQCGWLTDRFGLSWQIVPTELPDLITDQDPDKAQRAMQAMFGMQKIDIQALRDAHQGKVAADS